MEIERRLLVAWQQPIDEGAASHEQKQAGASSITRPNVEAAAKSLTKAIRPDAASPAAAVVVGATTTLPPASPLSNYLCN